MPKSDNRTWRGGGVSKHSSAD